MASLTLRESVVVGFAFLQGFSLLDAYLMELVWMIGDFTVGPVDEWNLFHGINDVQFGPLYCSSPQDDMYSIRYGPLSWWDVTKVENMSQLFSNLSPTAAGRLHQFSLVGWDVSNVVRMDYMFFNSSTFNVPLQHWNVSKVCNMQRMFQGCSSFNQPLNEWNVWKVSNFESMFLNCSSFNQPLNDWNVSKGYSMCNMFQGCTSFNQPLNNWKVSNVYHMSSMFENCSSFDQPLGNWDVSNVETFRRMFKDCVRLNQSFRSWKFERNRYLGYMFEGCVRMQGEVGSDMSQLVKCIDGPYLFGSNARLPKRYQEWNDFQTTCILAYVDKKKKKMNQHGSLPDSESMKEYTRMIRLTEPLRNGTVNYLLDSDRFFL